MSRRYRYVGPEEIRQACEKRAEGYQILCVTDLLACLEGAEPTYGDSHVMTFVIDCETVLRIADRHSEHVACAGGGEVRSAGEMTFALADGPEVTEVTNQSTGYCPEPTSWPAVEAALERAGLPHPGRFTSEMVFRRCQDCGQRNIVKEGDFTCGACEAPLPADWNFD